MTKKAVFILVAMFTLTSCYTTYLMTVDDNVKKVELEMSKEEVVNIMSKNYEVISRVDNSYTLSFPSGSGGYYRMYFVNNRLKELEKIWLSCTCLPHEHHSSHAQ